MEDTISYMPSDNEVKAIIAMMRHVKIQKKNHTISYVYDITCHMVAGSNSLDIAIKSLEQMDFNCNCDAHQLLGSTHKTNIKQLLHSLRCVGYLPSGKLTDQSGPQLLEPLLKFCIDLIGNEDLRVVTKSPVIPSTFKIKIDPVRTRNSEYNALVYNATPDGGITMNGNIIAVIEVQSKTEQRNDYLKKSF